MASRMTAIVVAVCAACGGGGGSGNQTFATGSATVSGTLGGAAMTPKDAVSVVVPNGSNTIGVIFISSFDAACAKVFNHQEPKNSQGLTIVIGSRNSQTSIVAPAATGDYPVYALAESFTHTGPQAVLQFNSTDATCKVSQTLDVVTAGKVALTRADANGYAGTFDATFSDTSHVTGTFTSAQCAPLANPSTTSCL
jgi:hypothetical protein